MRPDRFENLAEIRCRHDDEVRAQALDRVGERERRHAVHIDRCIGEFALDRVERRQKRARIEVALKAFDDAENDLRDMPVTLGRARFCRKHGKHRGCQAQGNSRGGEALSGVSFRSG